MKLLIINLCLRPETPKCIFPIGLGYIATAVKSAGFKFDLMDIDAKRHTDGEVEKIIRKGNYDCVAFGCIVTGYKIVKKLARVIKGINKKITIIAGNSVASSIPETILGKTDVDIAVMGEGD